MALADLVVVMNAGRIEQQGRPHDVFNAPRTEFVARFIGGHNVIPAGGGSLVAVRADKTQLSRSAAPGRRQRRRRDRARGRVPGHARRSSRSSARRSPS